MNANDFKHIYDLEPGDKWIIIDDELIIVNQDKIPFTINLVTRDRKNIEFYGDRANSPVYIETPILGPRKDMP